MYLEQENTFIDRVKHAGICFIIGVGVTAILGIIDWFLPGIGLFETETLIEFLEKTWFIPLAVGLLFGIYGLTRGEKAYDFMAKFFDFFI